MVPLILTIFHVPVSFVISQEVVGPLEVLLDRPELKIYPKLQRVHRPKASDPPKKRKKTASTFHINIRRLLGIEKVWGTIDFMRRAWRISPKAKGDTYLRHNVFMGSQYLLQSSTSIFSRKTRFFFVLGTSSLHPFWFRPVWRCNNLCRLTRSTTAFPIDSLRRHWSWPSRMSFTRRTSGRHQ